MADGQAALQNQIDLNISRGLTLSEFFGGKSGVYPGYANAAAGNNPVAYTNTVSGWLGIPSDVPLSQLDTSGGLGPALAVANSAPSSGDAPADDTGDDNGFDFSSLLDFSNPVVWIATGAVLFFAARLVKA